MKKRIRSRAEQHNRTTKKKQKSEIAVRILRKNIKSLIGYEVFLKLVMVMVCFPLSYYLFQLTMFLSGYRYLTAENLNRFLRHPQVYIYLLVMALLVIAVTAIDLSGVLFLLEHSRRGSKTDLFDALHFSLWTVKRLALPGRFPAAVTAALSAVLFSLGMVPSVVSRATLSDFIMRRLKGHPTLIVLIVCVVVALALFCFTHLYEFHFVVLEGCTWKEAHRRSKALSRHRHRKDAAFLVLSMAVFYLIYFAAIAAGVLVAIAINRLFAWSTGLHALSETVALVILAAGLIVFTALAAPVGYILISIRYVRHREEEAQETNEESESLPLELAGRWERKRANRSPGRRRFRARYAGPLLALAAILVLPLYIRFVHHGYNLNVEYLHTMEVTAHRGASRYYPENTMAAFTGAVKQGANWIELDVHESSDGQIFVMHDSSFLRTAGVEKSAWELTYDEIASLDAGSFFSDKYAGEQIPLLSEVIRYAKEQRIPLNIEIKPSGHEETLESDLVRLLEEEDFIDQCVVTSQSYGSISKVKDLNKDIKTIYVMGFAYGNINRLKKADGFSVRYTSVSRELVRRVHNAGREIYAWTVNNRWAIDDMIDQQVDNIITDNVPLARSRIEKNRSGNAFSSYLRLLNELI